MRTPANWYCPGGWAPNVGGTAACTELAQEPVGQRCERNVLRMMVYADLVATAGNVRARRRDDIAAICPDIDAGAERVRAAFDVASGVLKEDVLAAPSGEKPPCWGDWAVLGFELGERLVAAMAWIDIKHDKPGDGTGRQTNVKASWAPGWKPPPLDDGAVCGGAAKAAFF